ncbi:TetR/AcrR family transcriptional regulator [Pelagibaculum spongiae]|uniref:TetR family transcriptional regulator n=1 Tax=Pelagibaculum spongiae TaxID=2080658 RepID=A0A2V1H690_9GAMM|nr:TetR/AcrR family transcriptional regulator [Pelagibaculum spongiae]PVZ71942.1 TetR family transcriptional regulator [Pelagibaculum spongiae]
MARPRRSENTRIALLQLGVELLAEHGYSGTGLKQILDAAKVPKGSFYNYFASKEAFVAEVIEFYMQNLLEIFDGMVANSNLTPLQTIQQIYTVFAEHLLQQGCGHGCLMGSLAGEVGGTSELCRQAMQKMYSQWHQRFSAVIDRAQQAGEVRDDLSAVTLTDIFWNQWEGAMLRMQFETSAEPLLQSLDMTLNRLFKPLAA